MESVSEYSKASCIPSYLPLCLISPTVFSPPVEKRSEGRAIQRETHLERDGRCQQPHDWGGGAFLPPPPYFQLQSGAFEAILFMAQSQQVESGDQLQI